MNFCDISLYAILDPARTRGRPLADLAAQAAAGGATILQYRDKEADTRALIANAILIKTVLKPYGVPLLINDRVDVALASGVDGVHVGQSDMAPQDVRQLMGTEALVGYTIKTKDHALAAPVDLIDYACIGGIYETASKDNPISIGLDGWRDVATVLRPRKPELPVGAIAGIDHNNVADVLTNGADGVAVISAIFMADDVRHATEALKSTIEAIRS